MKKHTLLLIVGLLVILAGGVVRAQQGATATISGTVTDSSGAVLAGVKVLIANEDTGISRTAETDASGRYVAPFLSLGTYQVTGTQAGFQTVVRSGITLTVGREAVVDLSLKVGAVSQTVTVTGEAPLVESTSASLGSLVDDRQIRALPLNGRSYDQLALLQPGVTLSDPGPVSGVLFGSGTGKRFGVGGQPPYSNLFLLDGTNIDDESNGTPGGAAGNNLGVDTIQEFKVFTNGFKAEYGHSSGSVVTAVTRSGTNAFHGTAFEYIRNSVLDARNYFDVGSSPPPFRRNQFGGALGGPIKKDKTFFFVGYEGLRQALATSLEATVPTLLARQGILPTSTVSVSPAIVPYLNVYPAPNGLNFGDGTAEYLSAPTSPTNEDNVMVRVDHQLNAKTSIFARYMFDTDSVLAVESIPSFAIATKSRRQYGTVQFTSILTPKLVNDFRFALNRTYDFYGAGAPPAGPLSFVPGQPLGTLTIGGLGNSPTGITILGAAPGGNGNGSWAYTTLEWGDDLSYSVGKHALKAGVDIQRTQDNNLQSSAVRGSYSFQSLTTFLEGIPTTLQATQPLAVSPYYGVRQSLYALYVQDDYAVTSRLTLNLGLRWETATNPTDVNGTTAFLPSPPATSTVLSSYFFRISKANFEPRVGLAWQINGSGKTVLRASAGIYHNQLLPWSYPNELRLPPFYGLDTISNPSFPNGYLAIPPGPPPATGIGKITLRIMAPFEKTPVSDQFNLSLQQQISKNMVVQIAYAGDHSNHLPLQIETDTAIPTICSTSLNNCPAGLPSGTVYYPAGDIRKNPAWAGEPTWYMGANSVYNAGQVTLRRQSSSGLDGQIFYVWSRGTDDTTAQNGQMSLRNAQAVLNPLNPLLDWGLSEISSENHFGFNFTYPVPFRATSKALGAIINGWTLDGIGTFSSGLPFTPRLSAGVSRDMSSTFAERPNLNPGFSNNPIHGVSHGCPGFAAGTQLGTALHWYDPCAFSLPVAGTYGDLGRDTVIGPGVQDVDLALEKSFKLQESKNVVFRAEMFNIANHANFGLPNTGPLTASGIASGSAGLITYTTTSSRQLQFGLRFNF